MLRRSLRSTRAVFLCALAPATLLSAGCASLRGSFLPSPEEVPGLEARIRSHPSDVESLTRLGAAYERAGRLDEAQALLERARGSDPEDANAAFFLGLVHEDQERPDEAIAQYRAYLDLAPRSRFSGQVEGRIQILRRQQLRMAIRDALARERELANTTPTRGTVAVFPFLFSGRDEQLRPLGRALAEMLATDLSQTDRLTVLERVQIQALMDEVALGQSGLADPATAARGGRLLGAGRVVQGQVTGDQSRLRIDAAVVEVGGAGRPGSVTQEDAVARLFDMEKAMAFGIYEEMGIPLSPAERQRVSRRLTDNLQALLAYGRGLEAADAGRYQEAQQAFAEAASMDPGFSEAAAEAEATGDISTAESTPTEEIAEAAVEATVDIQVAAQVEAVAEQASQRDPAQEALGTEGVGKAATMTPVTIILRRPGGGDR